MEQNKSFYIILGLDDNITISENPPIRLISHFIGYDFHSPPLCSVSLNPYIIFPKITAGSFILSQDNKYLVVKILHYRPFWAWTSFVFNFEELTYCCIEQLFIDEIISFDFPYLTYHCYKEQKVKTRSIKYQVWRSFKDYRNKEIGGTTDGYYLRYPNEVPEDYVFHFYPKNKT